MKKYRTYAWFVLSYCVAVILWGAYVRVTGSGAGCGEHWPLCDGQVIPVHPDLKRMIEYTHRLSSGLSLFFIGILFVWSLKIFPKKSFQRKVASLALLAIFLEALLGAGLVLFRYVAHDQSMGRVISIALHLLNTLFLTAVLSLCAESATSQTARWKIPDPKNCRLAFLLITGFVLVGAFGAWTALGDTLFKPESLTVGFAADWSKDSHITERLRVFHPFLAIAWALAIFFWASRWLAHSLFRRRASLLVILVTLNLLLGAANIMLLAPMWLQILHLAVINAIWIVFIGLLFSIASRWSVAEN